MTEPLPPMKDQDPSGSGLGTLLQHCRAYLLDIANAETSNKLSVRVAPSDLVQETLAEALRSFRQFQGTTEEELRAWLRGILRHNIADAHRHHFQTQKRGAGEVVSIPLSGYSRGRVLDRLVSPISSPSSMARRRERAERLRAAINDLPEDYREVIRLRHFDGLLLEEVGERIGRTPEAVRKLWVRGLEKLAELLDHESKVG
jgi:RNA polymerase sigma-70 factor (ECF subfamily)